MIKKIRGVLKLFLPYGFMRRFVARRYGMALPPGGWNAITRLVFDFFPYGIALSMLKLSSDGKDMLTTAARGTAGATKNAKVATSTKNNAVSALAADLHRVQRAVETHEKVSSEELASLLSRVEALEVKFLRMQLKLKGQETSA